MRSAPRPARLEPPRLALLCALSVLLFQSFPGDAAGRLPGRPPSWPSAPRLDRSALSPAYPGPLAGSVDPGNGSRALLGWILLAIGAGTAIVFGSILVARERGARKARAGTGASSRGVPARGTRARDLPPPARAPGDGRSARLDDPRGSQANGTDSEEEMNLALRNRLVELEAELERLRRRIGELVSGVRNMTRMNRDLRERCDALERSNRELQDLQKRKEEVLAAVAHDIKNPAAAIRQLAEILQNYDLSSHEQARFVRDILQTSSRILKLSEELSNFMVMEVRSIPLDLTLAAILPIVEQVCRMNQVMAHNKRILLRAVVPPGLPLIEIDTARVEEVLDNLVSNAIKFSRPDSEVTIKVLATESLVAFEVIDHGLGLSEADLHDAFQMGRTLSPRPTAGEGSSGLGLWIVRKIVEAHRGVVKVRSKPGQGSTFTVELPVRQPAKTAAA